MSDQKLEHEDDEVIQQENDEDDDELSPDDEDQEPQQRQQMGAQSNIQNNGISNIADDLSTEQIIELLQNAADI